MKATFKLMWDQPGPFVSLEMVPELVPTRDLHRTGRRVPIQLKNVTDQPITLGAWMLVGQVSAATPVHPEEVKSPENSQQLQKELQHCSENLPSS